MLVVHLVALLQVGATAAVHGTVAAGADRRALAGVRVEADGRPASPSDDTGRYSLAGLSPGTHQLRFAFPGYQPREIGLILPDGADVRLDVELNALPVVLPPLEVVARADSAAAVSPAGAAPGEPGLYRLPGDWQRERPAGEADVQRAAADLPGVDGRGEDAASLHVQGGGSADNLTLLDGIPIYSAVHYGGSAGAVDPDAIAAVDVHTGVSPARFGDHLAGVLELTTADGEGGATHGSGALGPREARQMLWAPLPGINGGLLLAGRTSYRSPVAGEESGGSGNGYGDLLGVARTTVGGGRLRLLSFVASNRLDFTAGAESPAAGAVMRREAGSREAEAGGPSNGIRWHNASQGVSWKRTGDGISLEAAAWRASSAADIDWLGASGARAVRSRLEQLGVSARIGWDGGAGDATAVGFSLVRPRTSYAITGAGPLTAAPAIGSAFAERWWRPGERVFLSTGIRVASDFTGWTGLEPRLAAVWEPDGATRVGLGLGRTHQSVQSLVNEESVLGNLLGFALPAAAGSGAIPVARADEAELSLTRRLRPGLEIGLLGYRRRTSGLVLPAVSSLDPFAGDSLAVGRGRSEGVSATVTLDRGPLLARAWYTVARNLRTAGNSRYTPGFGHGRSLLVDLDYRLGSATWMGARFRAGRGRPSSVVAPGFDWQAQPPLGEGGELVGTPENLAGTVNPERLPGYSRLDLGVRREWPVGLGRGATLSTALSVFNLLDHANAIGLLARPDGTTGTIDGAPRGITFEMRWSF